MCMGRIKSRKPILFLICVFPNNTSFELVLKCLVPFWSISKSFAWKVWHFGWLYVPQPRKKRNSIRNRSHRAVSNTFVIRFIFFVCVCIMCIGSFLECVRITQVQITPWDVERHRHLFGRWAECYTYSYRLFVFHQNQSCDFMKSFFLFFFFEYEILKITTADFIEFKYHRKCILLFLVYGSHFPQQSVGRRYYFNTSVLEIGWRWYPEARNVIWFLNCSICLAIFVHLQTKKLI